MDSGFLSNTIKPSCEKEGDEKKRKTGQKKTEEESPGLKRRTRCMPCGASNISVGAKDFGCAKFLASAKDSGCTKFLASAKDFGCANVFVSAEFLDAPMFCIYFAVPIFLYIFLHSYLVCANNLIGANFETCRLRFFV
jgi:hypothetical protein